MVMAKDGGPAFPSRNYRDDEHGNHWAGLSLRDYFAAAIMQGLLACPNTDGTPEFFAQSAYGFADAMLAERAKTEKS